MQKPFLFSIAIAILFGSCSFSTDVPFYLVSQKEEAGALKKIGCEEYLVSASENIFGELSPDTKVIKALEFLFAADPKKYGEGRITATAIQDRFLELESVEKRKMGDLDGLLVSFKKNPEKGLAGVCDAPRLKEQIKETIRAAADSMPFVIRVDGDAKNWECIGDESGKC